MDSRLWYHQIRTTAPPNAAKENAMLATPAHLARHSLADFEAWLAQLEHAERRWEWINGEIFEVPSNTFASYIADMIAFFIIAFLRDRGIAGYVTVPDGGYIIAGAPCAGCRVHTRQQASGVAARGL
jgi:hypothetical protein